MTRNPATRNQARDRERAQRHGTLLPGKGGIPTSAWRSHPLERETRDARDETIVRNVLGGCSRQNRLAFETFLNHKRRRSRVAQLRKYVTTLADVDRHTQGTPWNEWTADQLRAWTDLVLARVKPTTSAQYALMPWAFLRHQYALLDRLPPNSPCRVAGARGEPDPAASTRQKTKRTSIIGAFASDPQSISIETFPDNHFGGRVAVS